MSIVKIPMRNGGVSLVSERDATHVKKHRWYRTSCRNDHTEYARSVTDPGIYMHTYIAGCRPGLVVDHRDGDGLNNTRRNLRVCTRRQNSINHRLYSNNTSGTTGVSWIKRDRVWRVEIRVAHGVKKTLGSFRSKADAISVRLAAESVYYKEFARS